MYPFIRLGLILWRARSRPPIEIDEPSDLRLTCWPWDCDQFGEMNNGRHLTLFDLGRFEAGLRNGFIKVMRKKGWGLVVGGSSTQYRRRIRPFERFTLRTRFVGLDEKWFYAVQTTYVGDKPCSQGLVRAAVAAPKGGTVPTAEVLEAMGKSAWTPPDLPDWVQAWAEADKRRPWPPQDD